MVKQSAQLEQAWERAVAAPREDHGPWRVLADALLEEGDARGELMQLELDAERGRLRGLAKGRAAELRALLFPAMAPPGLARHDAAFERAALSSATLDVLRPCAATDRRWRTVRLLRFRYAGPPPDVSAWRATPLGGGQLVSLEELAGVEREALHAVRLTGPLPRLSRLRVLGSHGQPAAEPAPPWREVWAAFFSAHPHVREVHLGHTHQRQELEARLAPLLDAPLERVSLVGSPGEFLDFFLWFERNRPRFTFTAGFADPTVEALVEFRHDELVVHAAGAHRAQARVLVESFWPRNRPRPPMRVAAE